MIDTYDRDGKAFTSGTYSHAGTYADAFENEPGKRVPKAGAVARAGVGLARAEWSVFQAEAKGPNASAGAGASLTQGVKAFASAELASASASAGPVKAKVGLALDTGVGISPTHVEAKVLGTGFSFGQKMGISLFGSSLEFNLCSAFNTVIPDKLILKLHNLGLPSSLCHWIRDFLTNRPQVVRIGDNTSSTLVLSTGTPQGCVLSPALFTLFTSDCSAIHSTNTIVKVCR
ncbi:hypothetical protein L3Q82_003623 [Scortum barcoo]|uniref:Uncharacterized protein n=1 Tax=Scortum barcoo TaxID=214431 RepID=A0ACB8VN15_9TELE|nr:hypothetical protein L3Q82_003623 [Scortum barcoo]